MQIDPNVILKSIGPARNFNEAPRRLSVEGEGD